LGVEHAAFVSLTTGYEHMLEPLGGTPAVDLRACLVAFDANVLLGLYRKDRASAENILRELSRIKSQVFLPAQAQQEFWLNRDAVLKLLRGSSASRVLGDAKKAVGLEIDAAAKLEIGTSEGKRLQRVLTEAFAEIEKSTQGKSVTQRAVNAMKDPSTDVIIKGLEALFSERTGLPYSVDEYAQRRVEAKERFTRRVPPGYEDADKPNQGYGDYILWRQLIDAAKREGRPVVLVTDDEKEDWWRLFDRRTRLNARFELVAEMRAEANVDFAMFTLGDFLTALSADPASTIQESAVEDSDQTLQEDPSESVRETWSLDEFMAVVSRLKQLGYRRHADVMLAAAAKESGVLSRAEVLRTLDYKRDAKLTGFTRAIRSVQRDLIDQGAVRGGLSWAFWAEYDGPGKAQRFVVPPEVATAFGAARADA
jgi:hypothetical protein